MLDIKTITLIPVEAPRPDSAPKESSVPLIAFTQYNYTTDYTVLTAHWQFVKMLLKAAISEQIESNSMQILQELSSPSGIH